MNVSQSSSRLHAKASVNRRGVRASALNVPVVGEVPTLVALGGGVALLMVLFLVVGGDDGSPNVTIN